MVDASPHKRVAAFWGGVASAILASLIVIGSRNLNHFDAALVGYTFATLFATFGIAYRYAMWLQRPPTRMYWRRGWSVFLRPKLFGPNLIEALRRFVLAFAANRFIFRRGRLRGAAHWLIMWGCVLAAAITFPLVWGWIHFETVPGRLDLYRTYVFGFALNTFPVESVVGFVIFHGLARLDACDGRPGPRSLASLVASGPRSSSALASDPRRRPAVHATDGQPVRARTAGTRSV